MTQEATTDKTKTLTRRDLAAFDKDATDLVLEMQLEGWQGFITQRGHAMMRHPDGSHQSITRSSNRAKSGTAMRANYESWKRRRAERDAHPVFGEIPEEPASLPVPVPTLLEMRQSDAVKAYLDDPTRDDGDSWIAVGYDDEPRAWAVFDIRRAYPLLVAHGSKTNEQGAWAALMLEQPDVFPVQPETTDQETVMASVYVCPEPGCGKQFDQQRKASVHNAASHHREVMDCPEPGCHWNGFKNMLTRHTQLAHETAMYTCGICGREFTTSAGLAMHRTRKHAGQVEAPVTVSTIAGFTMQAAEVISDDAPVTSPPGHDVLLEHLEHLPEGADAEAQVAAVRSIVAGPLVAEVRRLREELAMVTKERDKFAGEAADFEARLTLMREVMGV